PHVRLSVELQREFGLRRQEAIKFVPVYADQGDRILLKGSWTKGGKPREVPILTESQREILDRAHRLAGSGSLIPRNRSYVEQLRLYERETAAAGLSKLHRLRHEYAQRRYRGITGWKAPAAGGLRSQDLTPEQKSIDREARLTISRELGHEREAICGLLWEVTTKIPLDRLSVFLWRCGRKPGLKVGEYPNKILKETTMSNQFSGIGNLGTDPALHSVTVNGEDRQVAEMRVYFDRSVPKENGEYQDEGGFWLTVSLWGARAEPAVKILKKGARVQVDGILRAESWDDETGATRSALRLTASRIGIDPVCIESLSYRYR
ncbi:MAG: single-stranded DNA-binding protein, partial [Methylococcales bacterium]